MRLTVCFSIFALYLLGLVAPGDSLYFSKVKIDIEHSHDDGGHNHHHDLEEQSDEHRMAVHPDEEMEQSEDADHEGSHHHHHVIVLVSNVYITSFEPPITILLEIPKIEHNYQRTQCDTLPKCLFLDSIFRPPIA